MQSLQPRFLRKLLRVISQCAYDVTAHILRPPTHASSRNNAQYNLRRLQRSPSLPSSVRGSIQYCPRRIVCGIWNCYKARRGQPFLETRQTGGISSMKVSRALAMHERCRTQQLRRGVRSRKTSFPSMAVSPDATWTNNRRQRLTYLRCEVESGHRYVDGPSLPYMRRWNIDLRAS
ncbi:hypothetical protein LX36DRAFT_96337 [Colletotrichum falcatum]|nr:hypothetical protein LX36DRAFT_96337 [Colletotrichum falcatum]